MDDQQMLELLAQIQDLAGVAIDALTGGGAAGGPPADGGGPPPEQPQP